MGKSTGPSSDHLRGLALTTAGVLVLTPDALLLRLLSADPWTIVFWRGLLMAVTLAAGIQAFGEGGLRSTARSIGGAGLLIAILWAGNAVLFVVAITHTSIANTLIIIAAVPMIAAILSHLFLREPVGARTWAAIAATLFGVAIVVWNGLGHGTLGGDLAALAAAGFAAATFVVLRRSRAVNMVPATALSGVIAALSVAGVATPFSIGIEDALVLGLMGLVVLPVSFGLITLGPRYLPAPEVSLLLLLETVLGPVLVWLVLGEAVSTATLVGGAVVIVALAIHAILLLRGIR
ncbi:DMT family transporter [Rhodospirillaceae bacterium SYSU D60014]|uniref:DMT family transporter n=1 Tax=Virgifigura deserti TaxID=2268457 RepID=UPI000E6714DA